MEVVPYDPAMLAELTSIYCRAVVGIPHCYPVSTEVFAAGLGGETRDRKGESPLQSPQVLVVREGHDVSGFAHLALTQSGEPEALARGTIRFLHYAPGHRQAGQALLTAAEAYFREREARSVLAFHQNFLPCFHHLPHAFLTDRFGHVHALMGHNGYERSHGEVFLDWPEYVCPERGRPPCDVEVVVKWESGEGKRPDLVLLATIGSEHVGECCNRSGGRSWAPPESEDWFLTHWLGVEKAYQGKGLGRYLLHRGRQEMHDKGYRHAAISTSMDNHRALLFYSNDGYRVVDWTYGLSRTLE